MPAFGEALPRLRRRLRRDLALAGLPREKVLAVIVSLLDATRVRIGNAEYARDNDSYGLTTLRNRHVRFVRDGRLLFRFRGKGGAEHEIAVDDKRLCATGAAIATNSRVSGCSSTSTTTGERRSDRFRSGQRCI